MNILLDFYQKHPSFFIALSIYIPFAVFWNYSRRKTKLKQIYDIRPGLQPLPLDLGILDYLKAFISWVFLFMRLFSIKPGYYFTGQKNENSPLLVTCNNYLTVFLLARRIASRSVRLLIVDTNGINVWCASGKGRFSASEIIEKAGRFSLLKKEQKIDMILPKFCLSGVKLTDLRNAGIKPIIGPMYARDVPEYLDRQKFENRIHDHFVFGLQHRTFTALPTAVHFLYYFLGVYVATFWTLSSAIIWVSAGLAFLYPILFPFLPGKRFAVKGISLSAVASILPLVFFAAGMFTLQLALFWILFIFATLIFIGLSYTGNSPVSNYTLVKKETTMFLPVVVLLYLLIIPVKIFL
jgi:hypothetical protein